MVEMFKLVMIVGMTAIPPPSQYQTIYYDTWMECMVAGKEMQRKENLEPGAIQTTQWDCQPVMVPTTVPPK